MLKPRNLPLIPSSVDSDDIEVFERPHRWEKPLIIHEKYYIYLTFG